MKTNETSRIDTNPDLRKRGGNGWASAVFRFNISSDSYAKHIAKNVFEKHSELKDDFELFCGDDYFMIVKNGVPIIVKNYDFVELKRQEDTFAFDKWVEEIILSD